MTSRRSLEAVAYEGERSHRRRWVLLQAIGQFTADMAQVNAIVDH